MQYVTELYSSSTWRFLTLRDRERRSTTMFDKLNWKKDRMLFKDLVFRLEDHKDDSWELGKECLLFNKTQRMINQYEALWRLRADFQPRKILELGMLDGGSLVFWFEYFHPEKIVGIDKTQKTDSKYFQRYAARGDRVSRIKTYWGTDQADRRRLIEIANNEFDGPLDLVFDDASHMYELTKISFETLFPLLRPGGLYIIEDWSWALWSGLPFGFLPVGTELPPLIFQLVEATGTIDKHLVGEGSSQTILPLIANLSIYQDFVVLERGEAEIATLGDLRLEDCISRSPQLEQVQSYPPSQASGGHLNKETGK